MEQFIDIESGERLIERWLGPQFTGRRFLRFREIEDLGLVDNRSTLQNWMDAGLFPKPIRVAGPSGKVLVWFAGEIAQAIADRAAERVRSSAPIMKCEAPPA
jgi:predicted DNA-binding transcriptional regulator AlpA